MKWKDVIGFEGLYLVSDTGLISSLSSGSILRGSDNGHGYLKITLYKNGKKSCHKVHRLVMAAFVGLSDLQVDHLNGIKTDNRLENLEYVTGMVNSQRRVLRVYGVVKKPNKRGSKAA